MGVLVDSDVVLAMFCGDCAFRAEPADSPICAGCDYKRRIESAQEQHQQWSRDSPENTDNRLPKI